MFVVKLEILADVFFIIVIKEMNKIEYIIILLWIDQLHFSNSKVLR